MLRSRTAVVAGASALVVLLAYWILTASGASEFRVGPHDGIICDAEIAGGASTPGFCGFSVTPLFVAALVGIVIAVGFAIVGAIGARAALVRAAAAITVIALVIVGAESSRGNEVALAPGRGVFHVVLLLIAIAAFVWASRASPSLRSP